MSSSVWGVEERRQDRTAELSREASYGNLATQPGGHVISKQACDWLLDCACARALCCQVLCITRPALCEFQLESKILPAPSELLLVERAPSPAPLFHPSPRSPPALPARWNCQCFVFTFQDEGKYWDGIQKSGLSGAVNCVSVLCYVSRSRKMLRWGWGEWIILKMSVSLHR